MSKRMTTHATKMTRASGETSSAAASNRKWGPRRARAWPRLSLPVAAAALLVAALLALALAGQFAAAAPSNELASGHQSGQNSNYNNIDNLISDLLDDAGDRLKKSRLNSRPIKQTLRFGRSDPSAWLGAAAFQRPTVFGPSSEERLWLDELAGGNSQRFLEANGN